MNLDKKKLIEHFDTFLFQISETYNINFIELKNIGSDGAPRECLHRFISGKNKGKGCPSLATENGYCSKHQKTFLKQNTGVAQVKKNKHLTKTQQDIIEWLNTAVPQDVTILKKRSKGLFNESSEFLFDQDYVVQGKYINKKVCLLSISDIEKCEKMGWSYNPKNVEHDEEDDE